VTLVLTGAGMILLLIRPWAAASLAWPGLWTGGAFVALGLAGWIGSEPARGAPRRIAAVPLPLLIGCLAIMAAAGLMGGSPPAPWSAEVVGLATGAAVAEELFFRRFLYGFLHPAGTAVAVLVSAACFAVVHVTTWGWAVLPLDLAAGLVLSWQRAASGRWTVPAATHVLANLVGLR
jgi:membrane protease YdiL (CAAX protease family)